MASLPGDVRIGISGWRYEPWRGVFYPPKLPQARELAFASRMLPTIEINGSFYSLQRPEYYAEWHDETPEGFVFAVKGPKYITHFKRLKDVATPLANFFASGVFELRDKLGPILWQFPPQLPFIADRFDAFFAMLPRDTSAAEVLARQHDQRVRSRLRLRHRGPDDRIGAGRRQQASNTDDEANQLHASRYGRGLSGVVRSP